MDNHNLAEYHCGHCGREFIVAEIGDIRYCPYCGDIDILDDNNETEEYENESN